MKTAVIYARYSSDKQTEQSIEGQLHICYDYAKRNDITVVNEYIDRAMTGTNDNRKAFQQMLKDSSKKAWDYVLVYKLDRFSRNKYETAIHKKTLRDNGVKLLSAMENIPDTPEGIILESLLEGMAEYYSAELSQKVKRGMHETLLKGRFPGGYVLLGYDLVGDKLTGRTLVINEKEAEVVKQVFNDYNKGRIIKDILRALKSMGITNKGKPLSKNYLYNMLKNEKYNGIFVYGNKTYTNIYPKIIDDNLFNRVRKKLEKNHYGKHVEGVVYLLKNKIRCGYCGKPIASESGTAKEGDVRRYYKCSGRKQERTCNKAAVRKDLLEDLVINSITESLSDHAVVSTVAEKIVDRHKVILENQSILHLLLNKQKETDTAIQNVMTAIEKGIITETTKTRLTALEEKRKELDNKIAYEQTKNNMLIKKEETIKFLKKAVKAEPILLIDLLVKQIILYDDKMEITLNYTERPDGNDHQAFSFYTTNKAYELFYNNTKNYKKMLNLEIIIYI